MGSWNRLAEIRGGTMSTLKAIAAGLVLATLGISAHSEPLADSTHKTAFQTDAPESPVKWKQFPDAKVMRNYYPMRAYEAHVEASVTLVCDWNASGKITACEVIEESAPGYGFAQASIKMLSRSAVLEAKDPAKLLEAGGGLLVTLDWHAKM